MKNREVRVLQLVTQIEPAGAQTMAKWLESSLRRTDGYSVETRFMYAKSTSDLFGADAALAAERPRTAPSLLRLSRDLHDLLHGGWDAVIAHTHFSIAAVERLAPKHVPLLAVHHWPVDRYPYTSRVLGAAPRGRGTRRTDIFVSDAIKSQSSDLVIPNPVPDIVREVASAAADVDILIVARHAREKDLETPIRAMAELRGRRLTLVGRGELTPYLKDVAEREGVTNQVRFLGARSHDEVLRLMRSAQVVALTSKWEAMPMTILEAIACGAPLVLSDIPAHTFAIAAGAAVQFATGSSTDFVRAIIASSEPSQILTMSAGRAEVKSKQSTSAVGRRWQDAVDKAVLGGTGRD